MGIGLKNIRLPLCLLRPKLGRLAFALLLFLASAGAAVAAGPEPERLFLELELGQARVYPHQRLPVSVSLYVADGSVRNVGFPQLSHPSCTVAPFAAPARLSVSRGGVEFTVYRFTSFLEPTRAGRLSLGPARLELERLVPASGADAFFGGTQSRKLELASAPAPLAVISLPGAGRPADFSGALGDFSLSVAAKPLEVAPGDPITLRSEIRGTGSLADAACPSVSDPMFQVYPPHREWAEGRLACEQVLVPKSTESGVVPKLRFSFFDPAAGSYRTVTGSAGRVRVLAPPPTGAPSAPAPPRHVDVDASQYRFLAAGLAGAAALALLVLALRRRSPPPKPTSDRAAVQWLREAERALAAADRELFFTALFRALQESAAARLGLSPPALTGDAAVGALGEAGFPGELVNRYRELFRVCDEARFSAGGAAAPTPELLHLLRELLAQC